MQTKLSPDFAFFVQNFFATEGKKNVLIDEGFSNMKQKKQEPRRAIVRNAVELFPV